MEVVVCVCWDWDEFALYAAPTRRVSTFGCIKPSLIIVTRMLNYDCFKSLKLWIYYDVCNKNVIDHKCVLNTSSMNPSIVNTNKMQDVFYCYWGVSPDLNSIFIATNWTTKSPLFVRHQQTSQRSPNESIHTAHWVRFSFGRISHWVCQATPSVISCGFPKDGSCYKLNQFDKQTHKRQRQITFEFLQQKTPSYLYRYSTYLYIFAVLWRLWNKISVNCMQTEQTSIYWSISRRAFHRRSSQWCPTAELHYCAPHSISPSSA